MELARKLRAKDGKIIALHVIDQAPSFADYYLPAENEKKIHESAKKVIEERIGADFIIAGSHKPEMKNFLLGSTAARIVRHAPCSVHVIR